MMFRFAQAGRSLQRQIPKTLQVARLVPRAVASIDLNAAAFHADTAALMAATTPTKSIVQNGGVASSDLIGEEEDDEEVTTKRTNRGIKGGGLGTGKGPPTSRERAATGGAAPSRYAAASAVALGTDDGLDSSDLSDASSGEEPDEGEEAAGVGGELQGTPLTSFASTLSADLIKRLQREGIDSLFPVQVETLSRVMGGENVVVRSRTGSGKTLGFAIPVVELLTRSGAGKALGRGRAPRAIVLAPTRELANQVAEEFKRVAGPLRVTAVYGGVSMAPQIGDMTAGTDIVVGTPGRVQDLMNQRVLRLDAVQVAILDEADEMLRMGFKEDVEAIFATTPPEKQCMLWSATVPPWVREIAHKYLTNPVMVDLVGDDAAKLPSTVVQAAYIVEHGTREEVLSAILTAHARAAAAGAGGPGIRALVFTDTKAEAGKLAALSVPGVRMAALTGDMSQGARERTLAEYRAGRIDVICATDVAARGLDINDVELVLQYRLPRTLEAFVHRAGRTGRAGKRGLAVTLASSHEFGLLRRMERELGFEFSVAPIPTADASSLGEREASRIVAQVLSVPDAAAAAVVSSGLLDRITRRLSTEQALKQALAVLAAGGRAVGYKSLLSGARNTVTCVAHPGSPVFQALSGSQLQPPVSGERPKPAFERAAITALMRLCEAAGVPPAERPAASSVHVTTTGGLVFDMPAQAYDTLRSGLTAALASRGGADPAAASASDAPAVQVLEQLPVEVRDALAAGPGQYFDFDMSIARRRSVEKQGSGSSRGGDRSRDREGGGFRSRDRDGGGFRSGGGDRDRRDRDRGSDRGGFRGSRGDGDDRRSRFSRDRDREGGGGGGGGERRFSRGGFGGDRDRDRDGSRGGGFRGSRDGDSGSGGGSGGGLYDFKPSWGAPSRGPRFGAAAAARPATAAAAGGWGSEGDAGPETMKLRLGAWRK